MARHALLAALLLAGSLFAVSCGSASPAPVATATPPGTDVPAVPTDTPTEAPPPTVDEQVVETLTTALSSGSAEEIRPYVGYLPIGCSAQPAQAAPVCATSVPEGSLTAAFYFSNCTGRYLQADEIQEPLDWMAAMRLDAFYALPAAGQPSGQYAAVLVDQRPETAGLAWEAIIDDDQIVALIFSCALTPEELVAARNYGPPIQP